MTFYAVSLKILSRFKLILFWRVCCGGEKISNPLPNSHKVSMLKDLEVALSKALPIQIRTGSPLKKTTSMGKRASRDSSGP